MVSRNLSFTFLVLLSFLILETPTAEAKRHTLGGIQAWSSARQYGFQFYPIKPRDSGSWKYSHHTKNMSSSRVILNAKNKNNKRVVRRVAQVLGGNMITDPLLVIRDFEFSMFAGKKLKPGWKVVQVDLIGSFTYTKQASGNDLNFKIKVRHSNSVTIKRIILDGPAGASVDEAFGALPSTKEYKISGLQAWSVAKTYGFTFNPRKPTNSATCGGFLGQPASTGSYTITSPKDGVKTVLQKRCTRTSTLQGQVVGGNPHAKFTSKFDMFCGKRLAPGWTVKSLSFKGSFRWIKSPKEGGTSLCGTIELTTGRSASLGTVILIGPKGDKWKNAFKVN